MIYETEVKKVQNSDSLRNCSVFSYGWNDQEKQIQYKMTHTYGEWEKLYRRHHDIEMYWKKRNNLKEIAFSLNLDPNKLRIYARIYYDQFRNEWAKPWTPPVISDNLD